jgi:hypothetical protein
LEDLSEAELKAVADYARKEARVYPLWTGVVAAAEQRLDLLERYRTGRGKWVALVEVIDWDHTHGSGNVRIFAKTECETRSAAVTEAKKMLAEHIDELGENTRIEAHVVSEMADEIRESEASQSE